MFSSWVVDFLTLVAVVFIVLLALALVLVAVLYVVDITQTKHSIRHNYPVVGRLRYLLEHLGKFFRQYFFATDRGELPFNREVRSWAYRAAKNEDNTVPFGSTRPLDVEGTVIFASAAFPPLDEEVAHPPPLVIGPGCREPYTPGSYFNISAMSYGALSRPAVEALSKGAKKAGCWLNTGEGGLAPAHLSGGCDIVFQIGTAKYGVCTPDGKLDDERLRAVAARPEVKMIEVKLSQGAKPGKGGLLPGAKVTAEIAAIRGIPEGQDSISPNRHREIASVDQLLDFIAHVRALTGKPVGMKAVLGDTSWLDGFAAAILKRGIEHAPDFFTLDSADGGTGAAPMPLIDFVGLTINESLPFLDDTLRRHGLRERIRIITSGKLITPGIAAWAFCAGADFVNSARGFMFSLGCIQALQCNRNTCPTGITTHNKRLQRGLDPREKSERVANYHRNMIHELEMIAHSCGVADPRLLRREHARILIDGRYRPMQEVYGDNDKYPAIA